MTNQKNVVKRVPETTTEKKVYELLSQPHGLTAQSRMSSDPRNLQLEHSDVKSAPNDQGPSKQEPQEVQQRQTAHSETITRAGPVADKRLRPPQHMSADHYRRGQADVRRPTERKPAAPKQHLLTADTAEEITKPWSPSRHPHYQRYEKEFCTTVRAVLLAHHRCSKWTRYGLAMVGDGTATLSLGDLPVDLLCNILAFVAPPRKAWHGSLPIRTFTGHKNSVVSLALSPDSRTLVSASCDNSLKLWDVETGELRRTLEGHSNSVKCLAISRDGQYVVSGAQDHTIKVWVMATGEHHKTINLGQARNVLGLTVTPDNRIISLSSDRVINKWDLEFGDMLFAVREESGVYCATMTVDGLQSVIGSCDGSVKLHDLDSGKLSQSYKGHKGSVYSVVVTPDGRAIVSGSADNVILVRDIKTGELIQTLKGHSTVVSSVAVTGDGQHVVSASADKTVKIWDLATGTLKHTIQGFAIQVNSVVVTADGLKVIACSSFDNNIKMWSSAS